MARYVLIIALCFHCFISCSQSRYSIRKINAFFTVKLPGNIPVDENGKSLFKGPDTLITVYAEISGRAPDWKTAWQNDKCYNIYASLVSQMPFEAGTNAKNGKKVLLTPAAGNKLWQLTLELSNHKMAAPVKLKTGDLLLSGKYLNKIFFNKIDSIVHLTTYPSV